MLYYIINLVGQVSFLELIVILFAYLFSVTLAIVCHEVSHGVVAYWCGDKTAKLAGRLTLNPFKHFDTFGLLSFLIVGFGWAKPVPINYLNCRSYKKGRVLISLAGIITNLILAFIFSGLYYFFGEALLSASNMFLFLIGYLLQFLVVINLSLATFNLLPIYPLDGFNFIETFLRPHNAYSNFMRQFGMLLLVVLVVFGLYELYARFVLVGIENLFFSFWGLF